MQSVLSLLRTFAPAIGLAGLLTTTAACGPPAVQLRPAKTCDSGNIEDCRNRCDQNESRACYRLGWFTEEGQGVSENVRQALELYEKACNANYAVACRALAMVYERGDDDVDVDMKKSEAYYTRACSLGLEAACPVRVVKQPPPSDTGSGISLDGLSEHAPDAPGVDTPDMPDAPKVEGPDMPTVPETPSVESPTIKVPGPTD